MKCQRNGPQTSRRAAFLAAVIASACSAALAWDADKPPPPSVRLPDTETALRHRFTAEDEGLLEEIQHGCFLYFWHEVGTPACLVKDRKKAPVASIAAVGFQLASLPIGVERGWVTREDADKRAQTVLRHLIERTDNKRYGVYLHFPDHNTAGASNSGYMCEASTVDHSLMLAGAMAAATYFGGETARLVDRMIEETDWRPYAIAPRGLLSMGWKPKKGPALDGAGDFIRPWHWHTASDEERLIYFLAVGHPNPERALAPRTYYTLERNIRAHRDMPPFVVSYPGNMFTYFFAHLFIDYRGFGADDPTAFGENAPPVDWFENSRRATLTHRQRCIEESKRFRTLSEDRWGLAPCAARNGYIVPDTTPNLSNKDEWFEGTVSPYAAGTAIMFTPVESLAALRAFRELKFEDGRPWVWRDPSEGGYGLVDSFNIDQHYACDDYTGIDEGPLLIGIENARTGLVWKLFMSHPLAQRSVKALEWTPIK
jgi:hypothetical protein